MTAPAVYGAINAVKLALAKEGIAKGRVTSAQGKYPYRGIDDIVDACALPMAEAGLCVFQRTVGHRIEEHKSNGGAVLFYCYVECEFDFVAVADGSMHTARFVGESFDSGDKSTGKAETYAFRNCLAKTFVIPVNGADADSDKHESPPVQPRDRQPPPAAPRTQRTEEPPKSEPSRALPTRTSKNYPVEQFKDTPFTAMPGSALTAYIHYYETKIPTLENEHHRGAARLSVLAAQKELEARRAEESKSGAATA